MTNSLQVPWDPERASRRLVRYGGVLAVFGAYWGGYLGASCVVLGLMLLLLACYSRDDGLLILGPFARYELFTIARRKRPQLWRTIYALAITLMLVFSLMSISPAFVAGGTMPAGQMIKRLPQANFVFFMWFAVCTFLYVVFLAITQFSGVVAEERAGKRWEILLTTDLRPREILLGKAAGRLPQLLDPILSAVPILSASTLFGGVSPTLVLLVTAACLSVAVGVAGVAFFYSVFNEDPRAAMSGTVLLWVFYLVASGCFIGLALAVKESPKYARFIPAWTQHLEEPIAFLGTGNPAMAVAAEKYFAPTGESFETTLARATRKFAGFHLGIGLLFGSIACRRLRTAQTWKSKKEVQLRRRIETNNPTPTPSKAAAGLPQTRKMHLGDAVMRPEVSDWSLTWWERYGHLKKGHLRVIDWAGQKRQIRNLFLILMGLFFLCDLFVLVNNNIVKVMDKPVNVGKAVACIIPWFAVWALTIGPTLRSVQTIAREREKGTLEFLRLLPMEPREILLQKWWGCVTSEMPLVVTSLLVLIPGMITGYIHPASVFGYIICVPIFVMALCAYGLVFTVNATTPGKAVRNMIFVSIGLIYLLAIPLNAFSMLAVTMVDGPRKQNEQFVLPFFPPIGVGIMLFGPNTEPKIHEVKLFVLGTIFSLGFYSLVGYISWRIAVSKLERLWKKLQQ